MSLNVNDFRIFKINKQTSNYTLEKQSFSGYTGVS